MAPKKNQATTGGDHRRRQNEKGDDHSALLKSMLGKMMDMLDSGGDATQTEKKNQSKQRSKHEPKPQAQAQRKQGNSTLRSRDGRATPAHIPMLFDMQGEKKAGLAQYVQANPCFLDWMRGHKAGDHKELKGEWPSHIASRYAEGRKAWRAVETTYQDGQSISDIGTARGVDMTSWPEMSDVHWLVSIAEYHCLVRNNWCRLTDQSDPRVVPPPATRLGEVGKDTREPSQSDTVSNSGDDPAGDSDAVNDVLQSPRGWRPLAVSQSTERCASLDVPSSPIAKTDESVESKAPWDEAQDMLVDFTAGQSTKQPKRPPDPTAARAPAIQFRNVKRTGPQQLFKPQMSASQTADIDVQEVDREVRKVADTVRGLSEDVSVLKASVTNLEVGQLTTECYMQALLEAQGISTSTIQDRMAAAKQALDQSQRQRGLLGPSAKPLTQEPTTVGTQHGVLSQVNTKEETEREDTKHPRSEHVAPPTALSLSSNLSWHKKSLCDLNVTALHGILWKLASSQVAEGLRHKEHVHYVAALSHLQSGLFVVVRVIGNASQVTPWTMQYARVCSITKKASLSWALDIAGRAEDGVWTSDVSRCMTSPFILCFSMRRSRKRSLTNSTRHKNKCGCILRVPCRRIPLGRKYTTLIPLPRLSHRTAGSCPLRCQIPMHVFRMCPERNLLNCIDALRRNFLGVRLNS